MWYFMTNREILAELKRSYEFLYDIIENGNEVHCNGQLKADNINLLEEAKSKIEAVYRGFYKTLDKKEVTVNYDKETYYIDNEASGDYKLTYNDDNDYDYILCGDVGYYWYNDEDYLDEDYLIDWDKDFDKTTGEEM